MIRWSKLISGQADSKILWDATISLDANCARLGHVKPRCFGDPARLEKRLDFRVRDAKCNRCTTPCTEFAWALQNSQANGQKCEKPKAAKTVESRKQSGPSERTGTEILGVFPVFLKSSRGAKLVSAETIPFVTDCMTSRLDPRRTRHVAPALICGHPGTFGNLRSRRRSLTLSRHDSRLQTGIPWRTCKVFHGALHGSQLPLEDQQGRLRSY